mmetsp:Transcript_48840/g.119011  ORF Transcript_48840/g.119011 Transcript_48840/m.119011 type:complete len:1032 (-) Transcript_48840:696-3791(-)
MSPAANTDSEGGGADEDEANNKGWGSAENPNPPDPPLSGASMPVPPESNGGSEMASNGGGGGTFDNGLELSSTLPTMTVMPEDKKTFAIPLKIQERPVPIYKAPNRQAPSIERASGERIGYCAAVPMQVYAMLKKNFILAYRNRTATFLRVFSSFFFILLIFLVNEGIKQRFLSDTFFSDVKTPPQKAIPGIPACSDKSGGTVCKTFSYTPAPANLFVPDRDYADLNEFKGVLVQLQSSLCTQLSVVNPLTQQTTSTPISCAEADCEAATASCTACCEAWRVHRVVRSIMKKNGTEDQTVPIPDTKVVGFVDATAMDEFLLKNQDVIQGGFVFKSPSYDRTTFAVQQNSTAATIRGEYELPYYDRTVPMQVAASKAIARELLFKNPDFPMDIDLMEFAHPSYDVATFEGAIAPLFILGCAMFPFVIQMGEVIQDKELKFRQALGAMGLYELSYWLSWHIYESSMAMLTALMLYIFGCIFQFQLFLKNDFGVIFLSFWLFGQAMVGLAFLVGAFLQKSATSVSIGFGACLLGFILFFMISIFAFPYGSYRGQLPWSVEQDLATGSFVYKDSAGDRWVEPIFAVLPPSLLIKNINDFGALSATDKDSGLRFNDAYSYCTLERACNPAYSVGNSWLWFIVLYIVFSILGLYVDNVLPDAMGVRKGVFYFLMPSYWGFGSSGVEDKLEVVEESTDEDVIMEERAVLARANQDMDYRSSIEIRGLAQEFSRGKGTFYAVKCPWYSIGRRQLFALLGPNGAGKSTTINMLTGFLPPTRGNALVLGHSIATAAGMARVRNMMGVCPQFDILWDNLSAKQHLELFGAIKGISFASLSTEADRRIEEVRLTDSAHQRAGAFSGGMKRRLSVAISMIGQPLCAYLDEPSTGLDPASRRTLWAVIKEAKKSRAIFLTTHSMEEAEGLCDRLGIFVDGELRCIGNPKELTSRFGGFYILTITCAPGREEQVAAEVQRMAHSVRITYALSGTQKFEVPIKELKIADVFERMRQVKEDLEIKDWGIANTTLEEAFIKISRGATGT